MQATLQALRAVASPQERRRFRRVGVRLRGRMLDDRGVERDCRTMDISVGGALVGVEPGEPLGEGLVIYLERLGRVPARVVRRGDGVAAVRFEVTPARRERLAETLTWAHNARRLGLEDERREMRFAGSGPAVVTPETGPSFPADILDISLVGAAVQADASVIPRIGSWVRLGMTWGRVSRLIEGGFAVDFQPRGANTPAPLEAAPPEPLAYEF